MLKKDLWSKTLQKRDKTWLLSEAVSQVAPGSVLGPDWYEGVMECLCVGALPLSCRTAVLTLQPKKVDLRDMRSWWQVGLHFVDLKNGSKSLATWLKGHWATRRYWVKKGNWEGALSTITTRLANRVLDPHSGLLQSLDTDDHQFGGFFTVAQAGSS